LTTTAVVAVTGVSMAALAAVPRSETEARPEAVGAAAGLQHFRAFREPAAGALPSRLGALVDDPATAARFALDARNARAIGDIAHPGWYLIPGKDSMCFFDGAGGACSSIEGALHGHLLAILVPPPPVQDARGARITTAGSVGGSEIIRGVAPDGVTAVRVELADGQTQAATVNSDGAYEIHGQDIKSLVFIGDAPPAALHFPG
jgi:hypothetical protein